jgi:hypothetical protein
MPPKAPLLKQRIKKPKLLRSNPLRKSLLAGGSDPGLIDDEDVYVGYRRPQLVSHAKIYSPDDELPTDIEWKLFLARQVALLKYREVHEKKRA